MLVLPENKAPLSGARCACGSGAGASFGRVAPGRKCEWMCSPCLAERDPEWAAYQAARVRKAMEE